MRRIIMTVCALILSVGVMGIPDAEAKRLGGGKSTGMQRDSMSQPAPTQGRNMAAPTQNASGAAAAGQAARKNSWLGPVAGLAAGLGLAALASHLGLGEEFASFLLIALLVMGGLLVLRLVMRKRAAAPGMQYAGAGAGGGNFPMPERAASERPVAFDAHSGLPGGAAASPFPPGFDAEGFARQAKLNFLRMQAANDAGNLDDLREFTSPELFAEIQLQLGERGAGTQRTEVMEIHAEVLECVEESQRYVASVRFHGLVREDAGAPPEDFDEVWHLVKPLDGNRGWVVAGIQQRGQTH